MARHGRPPSPAPATSLYDFHESRDKKHATFFPCPPATPRRATAGLPNGFSRNTRHETRITAFFPPDNESLPRDNGFLPPEYGFFRIFTVLLPHNSSQFVGIRRNSPDTDRAAVRAQSAPATRPAGFSPATGHATWFSPALRRLQREQPQARPTGFHETRDTKHESRLFFESRLPYTRFPTISHHFPPFPGISRPPHPPLLFSLGFPACAVIRSSRRRPCSFLCGQDTMNPC